MAAEYGHRGGSRARTCLRSNPESVGVNEPLSTRLEDRAAAVRCSNKQRSIRLQSLHRKSCCGARDRRIIAELRRGSMLVVTTRYYRGWHSGRGERRLGGMAGEAKKDFYRSQLAVGRPATVIHGSSSQQRSRPRRRASLSLESTTAARRDRPGLSYRRVAGGDRA